VLSANPNPLIIPIPAGSVLPVTVNVTVSTAVSPVSFVAIATTASGLNWLSVSPFTSNISPGQPVLLVVNVQPTLLSGTTSTGIITLTPSNGTGALQIPVTATFGSTATLTAAPVQFNFAYQTGTAFPPAQNLTLTSDLPVSFSLSVSTTGGGNWLVASPLSGTTSGGAASPTNIAIQVNPRGLAANTYSGQILITNITANTQQAVMVTLVVSNLPILAFSSSGTTFNYQVSSGVLPPQQLVQVSSSGNPLSFTDAVNSASGPAFLIVSPSSGSTPQTLALSLNPTVVTRLAPGAYNARAVLTAEGAGNSPASYTVILNVAGSPMLNVSQSSLNFNYQIGQAHPPAPQALPVASTGIPLTYAAAATAQNCTGFLSVTSSINTTPGILGVSVNPTGQLSSDHSSDVGYQQHALTKRQSKCDQRGGACGHECSLQDHFAHQFGRYGADQLHRDGGDQRGRQLANRQSGHRGNSRQPQHRIQQHRPRHRNLQRNHHNCREWSG
jgi:hypothetical protein